MENTHQQLAIDEHRFPYSLFSDYRHNLGKVIIKKGEVEETMDSTIGRNVYRMKGAVSSNNYILLDHLQLIGSYITIQMCLVKPFIATFHIDILLTDQSNLRLSISTLYDGDRPRYLGRSLRLPFPQRIGWCNVIFDMNGIIETFCPQSSKERSIGFLSVKKAQFCSNMMVRDVITSDKPLLTDPKLIIKELSVKPQSAEEMKSKNFPEWFDLLQYCKHFNESAKPSPSKVMDSLPVPPALDISEVFSTKHLEESTVAIISNSRAQNLSLASVLNTSPPQKNPIQEKAQRSIEDMSLLSLKENVSKNSNQLDGNLVKESNDAAMKPSDVKPSNGHKFQPHSLPIPTKTQPTEMHLKDTVISKALSTPRHSLVQISSGYSNLINNLNGFCDDSIRTSIISPNASKFSQSHRSMAPADEKFLSLERVLCYKGGPALVIYAGRLLICSSGHLIILIDLGDQSSYEANVQPKHGLWKAFGKSTATLGGNQEHSFNRGHRQCFLRGHEKEIKFLETSLKDKYLASGEEGAEGLIIIWDLIQGGRVASLKPFVNSLIAIDFSPDSSMFVTAGIDQLHRHQIIVWDMQLLLNTKNLIDHSSAHFGFTVARQISEFSIHCIKFSPYQEFSLVSCGRENIRFWRIRKGHLPGRPVLLNEYSRGFSFMNIAYHMEVDAKLKHERRPIVFLSSNRGLLLKVNCLNDQILCAYQLHNDPITAMSVHNGYVVTGSFESKLRIWPLDFHDFLLESQHEGPITNIRVSSDGVKQIVGTAYGTLGVLNVTEHSYNTVLRSHAKGITHVVKRVNDGHEIATVGMDKTVRVWDILTTNQVIEFSSEEDHPTSIAFHLFEQQLACGFSSGFVRIFSIQSATVLFERKNNKSAILEILYLSVMRSSLTLVTIGMDGNLIIYDADKNYEVIKKVKLYSKMDSILHAKLKVSKSHRFICVASEQVLSIIILETNTFSIIMRLTPPLQTNDGTFDPLKMFVASKSMIEYTLSPETVVATKSDVIQPVDQLLNNPSIVDESPLRVAQISAEMNPETIGTISNDLNQSIIECKNQSKETQRKISPRKDPRASVSGGELSDLCVGLEIIETSPSFVNASKALLKSLPMLELFIVTEKLFIQLTIHKNVEESGHGERIKSNKSAETNPWVERIIRKFEFGNISNCIRDDASGLYFLSVHPSRINKEGVSKKHTKFFNIIESNSKDRMKGSAVSHPILDQEDLTGQVAKMLVVVDVKRLDRKLVISKPQQYQEHFGNIMKICPCLEFNKVVSVDDQGCLIFWTSNPEKIGLLFVNDSPSKAISGDDTGRIYDHNRNNLYKNSMTKNSGNDQILTASMYQSGVFNSPTAMRSSTEVTKDFEVAVRNNPALWSAGGSSKLFESPDHYPMEMDSKGFDTDHYIKDNHMVELMKDNDENSFEANLSTLSDHPDDQRIIHKRALNTTEQERGTVNPNPDTTNKAMQEAFDAMYEWEESNMGPGTSPTAREEKNENHLNITDYSVLVDETNEVIDTESAAADFSILFEKKVEELHEPEPSLKPLPVEFGSIQRAMNEINQIFSQSEAKLNESLNEQPIIEMKSVAVEEINPINMPIKYENFVISHRNSVPPCIDQKNGTLVASDGNFVVMKNILVRKHQFLQIPNDLHSKDAKVIHTGLSPYGNLCVAIMYCHGPVKDALCLVVWSKESNQTWVLSNWFPLQYNDQTIQRIKSKSDDATFKSVPIFIQWTSSGTLVIGANVFNSAGSTRRTYQNVQDLPFDFHMTIIPESLLLERGAIETVWRKLTCVVSFPMEVVSGFKLVPSYEMERTLTMVTGDQMKYQSPTAVVLTGGNKTILLSLHPIEGDGGEQRADIMWMNDFGSKGSLVDFDIISVDSIDQKYVETNDAIITDGCLLVAVDQSGSMHVTHFSQTMCPRSITTPIAASHVSGALRTLRIMKSTKSYYAILLDSHDIRICSMNIKQNGKTISVNLVLQRKVKPEFSPDYLICLEANKTATLKPTEQSMIPNILLADCHGRMSMIPNHSSTYGKGFHIIGPSECIMLQSPLTSSVAHLSVALVNDSIDDAVLIVNGRKCGLLFFHSITGTPLPFKVGDKSSIITSISAPCHQLVACGTSVGSIFIFNVTTGVEVGRISSYELTSKQSANQSSSKIKKKPDNSKGKSLVGRPVSIPVSNFSITQLLWFNSGKNLLCWQENEQVLMIRFSNTLGDSPFITTTISLEKESSAMAEKLQKQVLQLTLLRDCSGSVGLIGIIRHGSSTLDLLRPDPTHEMLQSVRKISLMTCYEDILPHGYATKEVSVKGFHLILTERNLLIVSLMIHIHDQNRYVLYFGSVNMSIPDSTIDHLNMTHYEEIASNLYAFAFHERQCAIVTDRGVKVVNILQMFSEKKTFSQSCIISFEWNGVNLKLERQIICHIQPLSFKSPNHTIKICWFVYFHSGFVIRLMY